jgi:hypothetical protein
MARLTEIHRQQRVALALSKQSSHHQGPTNEMSPSTKGKAASL